MEQKSHENTSSDMLKFSEVKINVLNAPQPAQKVAEELQRLMLRMKGEFMSADGGGVVYSGISTSKLYQEYLTLTKDLIGVNINDMKDNEKTSFFINVYNALTIHGLIAQQTLPSSILDIQQFWKCTAYNIGGSIFSLDDMEHGILRGNRPHPASTEPYFTQGDPRLKFIINKFDPRIHFALVCGAKSCPAISVYKTESLDKSLRMATESFCEQEVVCNMKSKKIVLPKIFQWYRNDFGIDQVNVIRWIISYVTEDKQYGLGNLLDMSVEEGGVDITYSEYDWRLNKLDSTSGSETRSPDNRPPSASGSLPSPRSTQTSNIGPSRSTSLHSKRAMDKYMLTH